MPDRTNYLTLDSLEAGYGKKPVLKGVSFSVGASEIVALIGHNGAGKSTLLKTVFGLIPLSGGKINLNGLQLTSQSPREMLGHGVVFIPQGNRVFDELTVRENLEISGASITDRKELAISIERVLALFPMLEVRMRARAGLLSGGEKQMLALAAGLTLSPKLLLLDEPSLGLAPPLVAEALERIQKINRDSGASVLIVEQKVREVLKIAHRVVAIRNGYVSFFGLAEALQDDTRLRSIYF